MTLARSCNLFTPAFFADGPLPIMATVSPCQCGHQSSTRTIGAEIFVVGNGGPSFANHLQTPRLQEDNLAIVRLVDLSTFVAGDDYLSVSASKTHRSHRVNLFLCHTCLTVPAGQVLHRHSSSTYSTVSLLQNKHTGSST